MIKNAEGLPYETLYAIICDEQCGTICLTKEQYIQQLKKPDHGWYCPRCGGSANWDDDAPASNPAK